MKGTVCQVGYLLDLYRDARSPEYKIEHNILQAGTGSIFRVTEMVYGDARAT